MKILKVLIILSFISDLMAKDNKILDKIIKEYEKQYKLDSQDIYKNKELFVNKLLTYKVELPKKIVNPLTLELKTVVVNQKTVLMTKDVVKKVHRELILLSILNNKILLKEGKNKAVWVKVGDKIDDYKILKIINNKSILVSLNNKIKIITINQNKNDVYIKVGR